MKSYLLAAILLVVAGRVTASEGVQAYRDAVTAYNTAAESLEKKQSAERSVELLYKANAALGKANLTKLTEVEKRVVAATVLPDLDKAFMRFILATHGASLDRMERWKNVLPPPLETPKLELITPKTSLPELRKWLKHEDAGARIRAAQVLGQIGKDAEPALPELDQLSRDDNYFVANAAKTAIMRIGTKAAMESIILKLGPYSSWLERLRAARDLEAFGPMAQEAIPKLINCFDISAADSASRSCAFCAAHTLAAIGLAALPALRKELKSEHLYRVQYSIQALGAMGVLAREELPALRVLCKHKDQEIAQRAESAVVKIEAAIKK